MAAFLKMHPYQASLLRIVGQCELINVSTASSQAHRTFVSRWREAVSTLARLHRVQPASVGLLDFGKSSGFYSRQLKTLGRISAAQASVQDIETKKTVGVIPHYNAIVEFLNNTQTQPRDRASLIHGDYKIDNLVFHNSEPRVIGILE